MSCAVFGYWPTKVWDLKFTHTMMSQLQSPARSIINTIALADAEFSNLCFRCIFTVLYFMFSQLLLCTITTQIKVSYNTRIRQLYGISFFLIERLSNSPPSNLSLSGWWSMGSFPDLSPSCIHPAKPLRLICGKTLILICDYMQ